MATDITVSFQAIKDTEIGTNTQVNTKGMITYGETKILMGTGNGNIDYLQILKDSIPGGGEPQPIIYYGQKTTVEIDDPTTGYPTMKNGLVYDITADRLVYIKKEPTETDFKMIIPIGAYMYAERYVAGTNITITDNTDGTKAINAYADGFSGYAIYNAMPTGDELADATNANKVYFIM